MARVKVCRLCGEHNLPDELFCTGADCGTSLADVSVVDSRWTESGAGEGSDVGRVGDSRQSHEPDPVRRKVRDSEAARPAPCALVFPWGRVPVVGQLRLGREGGFSPISGHLDVFSTVSRRHAMVGAELGQWTVRDLGSTNGTYLNGVRLAEGETKPIANGDRIGFSRSLQVGVEIAETGGSSGAPGR